MKKILLGICGALLLVAGLRQPADATACSIFYTWLNGDTITAARLNGNNTNFQTCGNSIDNTNIGNAGIFASQIKPTILAQALFGGTAVGYSFGGYGDGQVPLTVNGNSVTQSADLFDVFLNSGGQEEFAVDAAGITHIGGGVGVRIQNAALHSVIIPASAARPFTVTNAANSSNNFEVLDGGTAQAAPLINALNVLAPLGPTYTTSGSGMSNSFHFVEGSHNFASVGCNQDTQCVTATDTLTNSAVFANTNFKCYSQASASNGGTPFLIGQAFAASASTVTLSIANTGANLAGSTTYTIVYLCEGA